MVLLGVNIDHVATVREARKAKEPDPVRAAQLCEKAKCDSIVCHLREDRRHINDGDLIRLKRTVKGRLNLEMSIQREIVEIACRIRPDQATLVPERREELTTEGGLDVAGRKKRVKEASCALLRRGIEVSLFIDPDEDQIRATKEIGVGTIELHTGEYANATTEKVRRKSLGQLRRSVKYGRELGLTVNAGHGLDYKNVQKVAGIPGLHELNIGHSIIARSVIVGIERAVREMVRIIR
ncbi:MAG: pyridoxine 5'-phosphate synthase [Candidatus Omnitrophota bacterium]